MSVFCANGLIFFFGNVTSSLPCDLKVTEQNFNIFYTFLVLFPKHKFHISILDRVVFEKLLSILFLHVILLSKF